MRRGLLGSSPRDACGRLAGPAPRSLRDVYKRQEQHRMAIDTATGKEAPAEISSERVKDIFSTIAKKYERFNAISLSLIHI